MYHMNHALWAVTCCGMLISAQMNYWPCMEIRVNWLSWNLVLMLFSPVTLSGFDQILDAWVSDEIPDEEVLLHGFIEDYLQE